MLEEMQRLRKVRMALLLLALLLLLPLLVLLPPGTAAAGAARPDMLSWLAAGQLPQRPWYDQVCYRGPGLPSAHTPSSCSPLPRCCSW
jgi:hypothetical protein